MMCPRCNRETGVKHKIKFFENKLLDELRTLHSNDKYYSVIPNFAYHLGAYCGECGRWLRWDKQDDNMLNKYYEAHNENEQMEILG
jgi:hypothetical protein